MGKISFSIYYSNDAHSSTLSRNEGNGLDIRHYKEIHRDKKKNIVYIADDRIVVGDTLDDIITRSSTVFGKSYRSRTRTESLYILVDLVLEDAFTRHFLNTIGGPEVQHINVSLLELPKKSEHHWTHASIIGEYNHPVGGVPIIFDEVGISLPEGYDNSYCINLSILNDVLCDARCDVEYLAKVDPFVTGRLTEPFSKRIYDLMASICHDPKKYSFDVLSSAQTAALATTAAVYRKRVAEYLSSYGKLMNVLRNKDATLIDMITGLINTVSSLTSVYSGGAAFLGVYVDNRELLPHKQADVLSMNADVTYLFAGIVSYSRQALSSYLELNHLIKVAAKMQPSSMR